VKVNQELPSVVFLDRDGLIIEDVHFIKNPADARLLPGAAEGIAAINQRGVPVVVVTNQSGIARGLLSVADYKSVRDRVSELLATCGAHVDATYYCPHFPDISGLCDCRKPGTLLFEQAATDLGVDLSAAAYIGDRWRDLAPSRKLGGRAILVQSAATTDEDLRNAADAGVEQASTLFEAAERLFNLTEPPLRK
jgi:histidinol-phosphate phosphatase family domain/HAD-superfamily hydrolase, subfamily IIIA